MPGPFLYGTREMDPLQGNNPLSTYCIHHLLGHPQEAGVGGSHHNPIHWDGH